MPTPERIIRFQNKIVKKKCIECGKTFKQRRALKGICSEECKKKRRERFRPPTFKSCEICGERFGPVERLKIKFCSKECGYKGRRTGGKKGKKYPHLQRARVGYCDECGKEYRAVNDHYKRKQRFCSKKCFWSYWSKNIAPNISHPSMPREKNHQWKGENVGYVGKHKRVQKLKGKDNKCEMCGNTKKKKYEWANIDHKYSTNEDDYMRLCTSCHRKWDIENNGYICGFSKNTITKISQ